VLLEGVSTALDRRDNVVAHRLGFRRHRLDAKASKLALKRKYPNRP
jgi:hypothetical protein